MSKLSIEEATARVQFAEAQLRIARLALAESIRAAYPETFANPDESGPELAPAPRRRGRARKPAEGGNGATVSEPVKVTSPNGRVTIIDEP